MGKASFSASMHGPNGKSVMLYFGFFLVPCSKYNGFVLLKSSVFVRGMLNNLFGDLLLMKVLDCLE